MILCRDVVSATSLHNFGGVVLVVRIGKTDCSLFKQNIDNLRVSDVPVLGLVANPANRNSNGSY